MKIGLYANQAAVQLIQLTGYVTTLDGTPRVNSIFSFAPAPLLRCLFVILFLSCAFVLAVWLFQSKSALFSYLLATSSVASQSFLLRESVRKVETKQQRTLQHRPNRKEQFHLFWVLGWIGSCIAMSLFTIASQSESQHAIQRTARKRKEPNDPSELNKYIWTKQICCRTPIR